MQFGDFPVRYKGTREIDSSNGFNGYALYVSQTNEAKYVIK